MHHETFVFTNVLDLLVFRVKLFDMGRARRDAPAQNGPCGLRDGLVEILQTRFRSSSFPRLLEMSLHVSDLERASFISLPRDNDARTHSRQGVDQLHDSESHLQGHECGVSRTDTMIATPVLG